MYYLWHSVLFILNRNIHFDYVDYANELQGLIFGYPKLDRISIESYREESSTTTPFDMVIRNRCSRYEVAEEAIRGAARWNKAVELNMPQLLARVQHDLKKTSEYILATGKGKKTLPFALVFFAEIADQFGC